MSALDIAVEPFDMGPLTGDRGLMLEARTGYSGAAFSSVMPTTWLTENGEVEFTEYRVPVSVFRAWAAAVLDVAGRAQAGVPA